LGAATQKKGGREPRGWIGMSVSQVYSSSDRKSSASRATVGDWKSVASGSVVAQVAPKIKLVPGGAGYMKAVVSSPVSLWHHHLFLQRLSVYGQWVNIAALDLGQANGRLFRPTAYLPKGSSHVRVFLTVNQAGNGLLASHSGTQTIVRKP